MADTQSPAKLDACIQCSKGHNIDAVIPTTKQINSAASLQGRILLADLLICCGCLAYAETTP